MSTRSILIASRLGTIYTPQLIEMPPQATIVYLSVSGTAHTQPTTREGGPWCSLPKHWHLGIEGAMLRAHVRYLLDLMGA